MDDIYSCDPTGEVTADENIIPEEHPSDGVSELSEPAASVCEPNPEDTAETFSSTDYSFADIKGDRDPGEYADERYDEPYDEEDYIEADYDESDYGDADYDEANYNETVHRDADYDEADYNGTVHRGSDYDEAYNETVYSETGYDDADYDDADYDETYYDDEYYDETGPDEHSGAEYYNDGGTVGIGAGGESTESPDSGVSSDADGYAGSVTYQGPANHSYDPNGTEDEKQVYGSYYGKSETENESGAVDTQASTESESPKGPYTSRYDAYRFSTPEGISAESSRKAAPDKKDVRSDSRSRENKQGFLGRLLSAAVLAVVFGGIAAAVFLGVLRVTGFSLPAKQEEQAVTQTVPTQIPVLGNSENSVAAGKADTASAGEELTVPQVVEMCMPSMVSITNTSISQYYDFFGGANSRENVSAGSGIIVGETDTELLIATNNHVITNSSEITVTFIDEEAIAGTVKGTDADNDLAIVAVKLDDISEKTKQAIRVVTIGDSDALAVGESVVAIGNALGYGQSVSRGVISALGREVTLDGMSHQLIQTDASINPGNSGGALLNMRGELIGINEIKYVNTDVEGVGYAIPMSTAKPILESLGSKSARSVVDGDQASYIGIMCIDVPGYYVQSGYPAGVYVSEVTKGGPAEKAGVREGDIITAMDGISISTTSQLITYLKYYAAGEEIDFSISRLNEDETAFEKVKITITLGNRKDSGIDDSAEDKPESVPSDNTENGGFDVIPDEKR